MEGVAGCALWLLSDLGRSTTGEVVHVDAGFHMMGLPSEDERLRPTMAAPVDADVIIAGAGMAGRDPGPGPGQRRARSRPGRSRSPSTPSARRPSTAAPAAIAFAAFRQWRALGAGASSRAPRPADRADPGHRRPRARRRGAGARRRPSCASTPPRSPTAPSGEPLGYMLENRRIRAGLAEAVERAGIEVLAPARVAAGRVRRRPAPGDAWPTAGC